MESLEIRLPDGQPRRTHATPDEAERKRRIRRLMAAGRSLEEIERFLDWQDNRQSRTQ